MVGFRRSARIPAECRYRCYSPLRIAHPPLYIPWTEATKERNGIGLMGTGLRLKQVPSLRAGLSGRMI